MALAVGLSIWWAVPRRQRKAKLGGGNPASDSGPSHVYAFGSQPDKAAVSGLKYRDGGYGPVELGNDRFLHELEGS